MMSKSETENCLKHYAQASDKAEALKGTSFYSQACKERETALKETVALIDRLTDSNQRQVLLLRFVKRLTWDEAADIMGCSKASVYRYYRQALRAIETN